MPDTDNLLSHKPALGKPDAVASGVAPTYAVVQSVSTERSSIGPEPQGASGAEAEILEMLGDLHRMNTTGQLSIDQRQALITAILALPHMDEHHTRTAVVGQLQADVRHNIDDFPNAFSHITSIVETCLKYPNGLIDLINTLQFRYKSTAGYQQLKTVVAELHDQCAGPPPIRVELGEKDTASRAEIANGIIRNGEGYRPEDSVDYWLERFAGTGKSVRHLIINGGSGRGKTFFAKQLRHFLEEQNPTSRHAWLDCTSNPPSEETLRKLFRKLLSTSERQRFDALFAQASDGSGRTAFVSGTAVADYLERTLFAPDADPLYLYLDDFDRYKDALAETNQPLALFLKTFGERPGPLRIVATSRDKDLDRELKGLLSAVEALVDETGDSLSPFQERDTRKYMAWRNGVQQNLDPDDLRRFIEIVQGDPLLLDLIENEVGGIRSADHRKWLLSLVEHGYDEHVPAEDRRKYLRGLVFEKQLSRVSEDGRRAAQALSVLLDLTFNPLELLDSYNTDALVMALLSEVVEKLADASLVKHVRELQDRKILKPASFQFVIDSAQEYISASHLTDSMRRRLHAKAMTAFRAPERGLTGFAVWHQLQCDTAEAAFDQFCADIYPLEGLFHSRQLLKLHRRFREIFWHTQPAGWRWAVNQGKLAQTLYMGFGIKNTEKKPGSDDEETEWEMLRAMLNWYKTRAKIAQFMPRATVLRQTVTDTYLQCRVMQAIFVFENPGDQIDESDPMYAHVSPRDNDWLASEIRSVLTDIEKNQARVPLPVLANLACLEGCFCNGGGKYDDAVLAFANARDYLVRYEEQIGGRGVTLTAEQRLRLDQDYLEVASCWSRSRFLRDGPASAHGDADHPAPELDQFLAYINNVTDKLAESVEFTYGIVNLCYYYLAEQSFDDMRLHLDRAYRDFTPPTEIVRPDKDKFVQEGWIEWYIDALEIAWNFYKPSVDPAKKRMARRALKDQVQRFRREGSGYSRDEQMFTANRFMFKLAETQTAAQRRIWIAKFDRWMFYGKRDSRGIPGPQDIHTEPVVRDLLVYLKACAAAGDGNPQEDAEGCVSRTRRRFPAFAGPGSPDFCSPDWKPPYVLRGALQMRPRGLAPMPSELGM